MRFDEARSDHDESEGTTAASFGCERPLSAGVDNPKVKRGAGRPGRVAQKDMIGGGEIRLVDRD